MPLQPIMPRARLTGPFGFIGFLEMIGSCLAQRYEIVGELGRGGMGVVYRAKDLHLGREVAVKVLPLAGIGGVAEERFMREALLAAKMDHPSIVPIYDLGRHEDVLFFVMPVVDGETLHAARRRGSLSLGETLEIVAQVAEALDYSHQLAVVHRDIKPENVMVSRNEEPADGSPDDPSEGLSDDPSDGLRLRARVMDFGLALVTETENRLTQTGSLPGTLGYLSPEQILGSTADGRSDLYSLGTILYECLAGKPPFSGAAFPIVFLGVSCGLIRQLRPQPLCLFPGRHFSSTGGLCRDRRSRAA